MEIGDTFNRLRALHRIDGERWRFLCECGAEKTIYRRNVERGASKSCGCLQRERTSAAKRTHGHSTGGRITPEFHAYRSMIARCYRPSNISYPRYGGRGITVCDRWKESFENFLADVGPRPSPSHSIDRHPDNDGPYAPWNVRWAVSEDQGRNKRNNLVIYAFGRSIVLSEAAEEFGIPYTTLKARIYKHGWDAERALSQPVRSMRR